MIPATFRGRYLVLLLLLSVLGMVYPLLGVGGWGPRIWLVCFWGVLLGATWAVQQHPRVRLVAKVLAGAVIVLGAVGLVWDPGGAGPWFRALVSALSLVFLAFTTAVLLYDVLGGRRVDVDKMFGAVCVYVLVGLVFAELFLLIGHAGRLLGAAVDLDRREDAMYFSFTTLSTLGYGDIVPRNDTMKVFAPLEAIVGQLYLTILVARLVGLHLSQRGGLERDLP